MSACTSFPPNPAKIIDSEYQMYPASAVAIFMQKQIVKWSVYISSTTVKFGSQYFLICDSWGHVLLKWNNTASPLSCHPILLQVISHSEVRSRCIYNRFAMFIFTAMYRGHYGTGSSIDRSGTYLKRPAAISSFKFDNTVVWYMSILVTLGGCLLR